MSDSDSRRPLASRQTLWANTLAQRLANSSVTPNQISMASMAMAAISGLAFWTSSGATGVSYLLLLIAAALFCQLRLLCNLLDGMVAVEGGKGSATGAFWNEFPDRIADIFILVGLGYAAGAPVLGWAVAAFAVLTAYVRELGQSAGAPVQFCGPMAKPHRMAAVTLAAVLAILEPLWSSQAQVLKIALWIILIGTGVTVLRRAGRILKSLNA